MPFQRNKRAPSRRKETFHLSHWNIPGSYSCLLVGRWGGGRVLLVVYTVESKDPSLADNHSSSTCINILGQVYLKGRLIVKIMK